MSRRRSPEWLRSDTAFWLGNERGEAGARLLARMIAQDPSDKVREKVTFALSVSKVPAALTTLIATARNDRSTKVRSQALFWLAQKAGKEATAVIAGAIDNDPDTEVKKKAVFALSQLPKDEGVPKLMDSRAHQPQPGGPQASDVLARPVERSARAEVLRRNLAEVGRPFRGASKEPT